MGHTDNEHGVPHYWGKTGLTVQRLITLVAITDFLLFGYDQGVMSGIISGADFQADFPVTSNSTSNSDTWQAFITAIYAVGCLFGALLNMKWGDTLGRRRAIFLGGIVMIVGVIIQVATMPSQIGHTNATAQFIVGRFITGIGNGINTSTVPTYQAECCPPHNRGKLICIEGGNVATGTLIAYWIDYGCSFGPHGLTWRLPIAFQCIFAIIVLILMLRLPESPRWLLTHGQKEEATTVLAALHGENRRHDGVQTQLSVLTDAIDAAGVAGKTRWSELLTGGKQQHFRRMLLGGGSQMMQQLSGCNAVIYYFPILFENSIKPGDHNFALLMGGVNMVVYAIFATTSWFLVERVGRRKLFLIGVIGQCLSMVLTFGALIPGTESAADGAAVGLFTYIAFFGAMWLPLPWLYPAEINPLKTRAKANAVSTVSNWLWNFFVVMITPIMINGTGTSGWGTYAFFAAMNACFFPIIYFFYPETAGRSLEEIDLIFAKGCVEKISYVQAAEELPKLSETQVQEKAREYAFKLEDEEGRASYSEKGAGGTPPLQKDTREGGVLM